MSDRTFKLASPLMEGGDIKEWQQTVVDEFDHLGVKNVPLEINGRYDSVTRAISATFFKAAGLSPNLVKNGITPGIRRKIRDRRFTELETKRRHTKELKAYRDELSARWKPEAHKVHTPTTRILADTWGFHLPIHDGLDLITPPDVPIFAMVRSKVIDVRSSGWWGKGAPKDPNLKAKGDGIIQLEVLEDIGPFKRGMHIGYGHAEKAQVKVGQTISAGQVIGHAGLANAWHIHLMVNDGKVGTRGVGNINPEPLYRFAVKNT